MSDPPEADAVLDLVGRHLAPGLALMYRIAGQGAVEARADGAAVTLSDGRELVDFGSYGVTLLGHRHPAVVAAVHAQLDVQTSATRSLANPVTVAFAAALLERFHTRFERVWLGSDGADAVEAAIKLARRRTGRLRVLAVRRGFHGKTLGALALTAHPAFRTGLDGLLGHVTHIAPEDPGAVAREAAHGDVAALVFEPIQGEGGVHPLSAGVLGAWVAAAHAAGAYVISDEIQVGLGRCGERLSVAEDLHLDVDAVLLGKSLAGGVLPLAALVATADLAQPLVKDPTWHSATFGGHPLACSAGLATLGVLGDEDLRARGRRLSAALAQTLHELAAEHDTITAVRGQGLLWGLQLRTPALAGSVLIDLAQSGLLVSPCLGASDTIRLLPPVVTTPAQLERAQHALRAALAAAADLSEE